MVIIDGVLKKLEESDLGNTQEKDYCGNEITITVPEGVTAIENGVFEELRNIDTVILPQSLESIGYSAFKGCSIKKIDIPGNVKKIRGWAFSQCRSLKEISLPNGLEEIGKEAFEVCYSLTHIKIPYTVKTLGTSTFWECAHLEHAFFEKDDEGKCALTEIPGCCFDGCRVLEDLILPEGIESIQNYALDRCENIRKIVLPSTLEKMDQYVCGGMGRDEGNQLFRLRYLNIKTENPGIVRYMARVISINSRAYVFVQSENSAQIFRQMRSYTQVYTGHKERDVKDLEVKYNGNVPTEIPDFTYASNDECKTLDIEGKIRRIGRSAFMDCKRLKTAVIHDGVEIIDDKAFAGCQELEEVVLPTTLKELGSGVFQGCLQLKRVFIPNGIEAINSECFDGCKSLVEIIIPESVKEIDEKAFYNCEKLERITFPTTLKRIGRRAFANCKSLIQLDIASKLKMLEAAAFEGCKSLLQVESSKKLPEGFEKAFPKGSIVVREIGKKQTRTYEILDGKIASDSSEKDEEKTKDITVKEGDRRQTDYLAIVEKPGLFAKIRDLILHRKTKERTLSDIRSSTKRHVRDERAK